LRDARDRLVEDRIVDADAAILGELELGLLADHALQHLLLEHLLRRQRGALAAQAVGGKLHLLGQIEAGDDLFVHHRDDAVDFEHPPCGR
jgi:hypothetical protein